MKVFKFLKVFKNAFTIALEIKKNSQLGSRRVHVFTLLTARSRGAGACHIIDAGVPRGGPYHITMLGCRSGGARHITDTGVEVLARHYEKTKRITNRRGNNKEYY